MSVKKSTDWIKLINDVLKLIYGAVLGYAASNV